MCTSNKQNLLKLFFNLKDQLCIFPQTQDIIQIEFTNAALSFKTWHYALKCPALWMLLYFMQHNLQGLNGAPDFQ